MFSRTTRNGPATQLAEFALEVLQIMERDDAWSADTLDRITDCAVERRLVPSEHDVFRVRNKVKLYARARFDFYFDDDDEEGDQ